MTVLVLQPDKLEVDAGGQVSATLTVRNTTAVVERYTIDILGAPGQWAQADPPAISLLPGTERAVTIVFRPPRRSEVAAATHPFAVKVNASELPEETSVEEGDITVRPFSELEAKISPRTSRGSRVGRHVLRLTNRGNLPVHPTIAATDPDGLLTFRVRPATVSAEPGATVNVRVDVRPRQTNTFGPAEHRPFQVLITTPAAAPAVIEAAFVQRSLFPKWVPRAAVVVVALVLATVIYAKHVSKVKNVAVPASALSTPKHKPVKPKAGATTTTTATHKTTTTVAATTTVPGTLTFEPNVVAADLGCQNYTKVELQNPTAGATTTTTTTTTVPPATATTTSIVPTSTIPTTTTTTATGSQLFQVTTDNPNVTFGFTNQNDALSALQVLIHYTSVCLTSPGANAPAQQAMVLEPYNPQVQSSLPSTNCQSYNNTSLHVFTDSPVGPYVGDTSTVTTGGTVTILQHFLDNNSAAVGLLIAQAHSQLCWVGGGNTFVSLSSSTPPGILEYWR